MGRPRSGRRSVQPARRRLRSEATLDLGVTATAVRYPSRNGAIVGPGPPIRPHTGEHGTVRARQTRLAKKPRGPPAGSIPLAVGPAAWARTIEVGLPGRHRRWRPGSPRPVPSVGGKPATEGKGNLENSSQCHGSAGGWWVGSVVLASVKRRRAGCAGSRSVSRRSGVRGPSALAPGWEEEPSMGEARNAAKAVFYWLVGDAPPLGRHARTVVASGFLIVAALALVGGVVQSHDGTSASPGSTSGGARVTARSTYDGPGRSSALLPTSPTSSKPGASIRPGASLNARQRSAALPGPAPVGTVHRTASSPGSSSGTSGTVPSSEQSRAGSGGSVPASTAPSTSSALSAPSTPSDPSAAPDPPPPSTSAAVPPTGVAVVQGTGWLEVTWVAPPTRTARSRPTTCTWRQRRGPRDPTR